MRATAINRQFMANTGDRIAGRIFEPRRAQHDPCSGAHLPDGVHVTRPPSGDFLAHARCSASRAGCAGTPDDGRAAVAASAVPADHPQQPAELTVSLCDGVLLTLRLAASAAGVSLDEAVQRAICRYADSLGLQVLAEALALDPDLARDMAAPGLASRFKGGP